MSGTIDSLVTSPRTWIGVAAGSFVSWTVYVFDETELSLLFVIIGILCAVTYSRRDADGGDGE